MPVPGRLTRSTCAGDWYLPADGGAGSLLRVADGVAASAVRRVRDLALPGLLPIGNVVQVHGQVWLRTPQPPGPTIRDLVDVPGLGLADAAAVLVGVVETVTALHRRRLTLGGLDDQVVLLDPDGAPSLVAIEATPGDRYRDLAGLAALARTLADAWCAGDPAGAAVLRRCGDLMVDSGPGAATAILPAPSHPAVRAAAAGAWARALVTPEIPAQRTSVEPAEGPTAHGPVIEGRARPWH